MEDTENTNLPDHWKNQERRITYELSSEYKSFLESFLSRGSYVLKTFAFYDFDEDITAFLVSNFMATNFTDICAYPTFCCRRIVIAYACSLNEDFVRSVISKIESLFDLKLIEIFEQIDDALDFNRLLYFRFQGHLLAHDNIECVGMKTDLRGSIILKDTGERINSRKSCLSVAVCNILRVTINVETFQGEMIVEPMIFHLNPHTTLDSGSCVHFLPTGDNGYIKEIRKNTFRTELETLNQSKGFECFLPKNRSQSELFWKYGYGINIPHSGNDVTTMRVRIDGEAADTIIPCCCAVSSFNQAYHETIVNREDVVSKFIDVLRHFTFIKFAPQCILEREDDADTTHKFVANHRKILLSKASKLRGLMKSPSELIGEIPQSGITSNATHIPTPKSVSSKVLGTSVDTKIRKNLQSAAKLHSHPKRSIEISNLIKATSLQIQSPAVESTTYDEFDDEFTFISNKKRR